MGFITLGGVFAANMTGNTVLAGIAGAQGRYLDSANHLAPLAGFFVGCMIARLLLRLWQRPAIPILIEAALLVVVGFLPIGIEPAVLIVALAMGLQASAITHFAGAAVSTVVVTSTLARTAEAALDRLWPMEPRKPLPAVTTPRLLALTWTGYLAGAAAGVLLLEATPWPLIAPAALLLPVILLGPRSTSAA